MFYIQIKKNLSQISGGNAIKLFIRHIHFDSHTCRIYGKRMDIFPGNQIFCFKVSSIFINQPYNKIDGFLTAQPS